jgi:hypothetical protein
MAKQASPNQGGSKLSKLPHSRGAPVGAQACLRLVPRQLAAAPPKLPISGPKPKVPGQSRASLKSFRPSEAGIGRAAKKSVEGVTQPEC